MPALQVKKVVGICFLEAVKVTLEHLGTYRLELSQKGVPGPPDLARQYGDVRRLRDLLQRCMSAYQDLVDIDLSAADAGLLVACCRREIGVIEVRLSDSVVPNDEREWLKKKRLVLADWAVELAQKPLLELSMPRPSTVQTDFERGLHARFQTKLFGDVSSWNKITPPQSGHSSMSSGLASFGEQLLAVEPSPHDTDGGQAPRMAPSAPLPVVAEAPADVPTAGGAPLLDRRRIGDPRLRSLVGLDLGSFDRCVAAGDHRLATVMLCSIVEGVVLDHAIPRRGEFALQGAPDTWNVHDILLQAMGDALQPKDRALAFHLFAARNLVRPATQMLTPTAVTAASFERLRDFAVRAFHALGFGAGAATAQSSSIESPDA